MPASGFSASPLPFPLPHDIDCHAMSSRSAHIFPSAAPIEEQPPLIGRREPRRLQRAGFTRRRVEIFAATQMTMISYYADDMRPLPSHGRRVYALFAAAPTSRKRGPRADIFELYRAATGLAPMLKMPRVGRCAAQAPMPIFFIASEMHSNMSARHGRCISPLTFLHAYFNAGQADRSARFLRYSFLEGCKARSDKVSYFPRGTPILVMISCTLDHELFCVSA